MFDIRLDVSALQALPETEPLEGGIGFDKCTIATRCNVVATKCNVVATKG